jgi:pyridoxal phosphate enzyme (YggS family)
MFPTSSSPDDAAPAEGEARRDALVANLAAVRARLAAAARDSDRDPASITLIAVTKTHPASDAATLVRLGVEDLGENRDQEARAKVAEVARLLGDPDPTAAGVGPGGRTVRWHFLGQVQSRKVRSIARYADVVHAVDRPELVRAFAAAVTTEQRAPLSVFVQVSLDGDPARGGALPGDVLGLADQIAAAGSLRLLGVMAIAPLDAEPAAAFGELAVIAERLRRAHPDATAISAGMSGDLEQAIAAGATHVRVGTALLGPRSPLLG